jgi:hypothetical protein
MANKINKALIKKTGEVLDVRSMTSIQMLEMTFTYDTDTDTDTETKSSKIEFKHEGSKDYPIDDVELSDGKTYKKSELVIGVDNIREFKLKNIMENNRKL